MEFDAKWYLSQYTDVSISEIDPYLHYVKYGQREGRHPTPPDWVSYFRDKKSWLLVAVSEIKSDNIRKELIKNSPDERGERRWNQFPAELEKIIVILKNSLLGTNNSIYIKISRGNIKIYQKDREELAYSINKNMIDVIAYNFPNLNIKILMRPVLWIKELKYMKRIKSTAASDVEFRIFI
jgi:hypothetical protein